MVTVITDNGIIEAMTHEIDSLRREMLETDFDDRPVRHNLGQQYHGACKVCEKVLHTLFPERTFHFTPNRDNPHQVVCISSKLMVSIEGYDFEKGEQE